MLTVIFRWWNLQVTDPVNDEGFLQVGGGHRIHWQDWGNPDGVPIVLLHGGPGAGFDDSHQALFDPARHHVLLHDQRGSGRSTPFAGTDHNTTADLVEDIAALLELRGWESAHLAGGSWGSTLALMFAMTYTNRVRSLLLWSVYLARRFDDEWVMGGPPRYFFPRERERFVAMIPPEHRTDPAAMTAYYRQRLDDADPDVARQYAVEWRLWETALCSLEYDPCRNELDVATDPSTLAIARLEIHYFAHSCFLPENHILGEVGKLRDVPCTLIHGRFDMCTPPSGADDLARAYGDRLWLEWVNAGHSHTDPNMNTALRKAVDALR